MATVTWIGGAAGWYTAADWSTGTAPDATSDVVVPQGDPQFSGIINPINSLTVTAGGQVSDEVMSAAIIHIYGDVTNSGYIGFDDHVGTGNGFCVVGGNLNNSGQIVIGNTSLLNYRQGGASTSVTAAAINNSTSGSITLYGNGSV